MCTALATILKRHTSAFEVLRYICPKVSSGKESFLIFLIFKDLLRSIITIYIKNEKLCGHGLKVSFIPTILGTQLFHFPFNFHFNQHDVNDNVRDKLYGAHPQCVPKKLRIFNYYSNIIVNKWFHCDLMESFMKNYIKSCMRDINE